MEWKVKFVFIDPADEQVREREFILLDHTLAAVFDHVLTKLPFDHMLELEIVAYDK